MGNIIKVPEVDQLKKVEGLQDTDQGVYSGEINQANEREGHGRQDWLDGSYYEGEWKDNLKHGFGEYSDQKYKYIGQWKNGAKHGKGKLEIGN